MNEQKEIIIERKANNAVKAIDRRYSALYTCDYFVLCFDDKAIGAFDTMQGMLESANIHKENRG